MRFPLPVHRHVSAKGRQLTAGRLRRLSPTGDRVRIQVWRAARCRPAGGNLLQSLRINLHITISLFGIFFPENSEK